MPNKVFVIGVGMTKFDKPGRREGWDYPAMAKEAGLRHWRTPESPMTELSKATRAFALGNRARATAPSTSSG
ncbi:hypothetical protein I553_2187 [Mycobacterium xenopi 4042]|uniref:Uncharacterized protein n=1 Tax=Mycobacterium xenopi 4042 TaxID=1299334 RepID=X8DKS3_MYCXE|nr:hypothetical protein I553_2187 [Mycobacterium xenopi 4042]